MTAPASRKRRMTVASSSATACARMPMPAVVGTPLMSKMSFTATGTPCNGPRSIPRAISCSARRASASADSAVTRMYAFRCPSSCAMRASIACVNSTGDRRRCRNCDDTSSRLRYAKCSCMAVGSRSHKKASGSRTTTDGCRRSAYLSARDVERPSRVATRTSSSLNSTVELSNSGGAIAPHRNSIGDDCNNRGDWMARCRAPRSDCDNRGAKGDARRPTCGHRTIACRTGAY